jgi:hypothetical protein
MSKSNLNNWWESDERLDTPQAAEFFGMKVGSFYVATSSGRLKLPKYRWGGKDYYRKSDCLKAIEKTRIDPEADNGL